MSFIFEDVFQLFYMTARYYLSVPAVSFRRHLLTEKKVQTVRIPTLDRDTNSVSQKQNKTFLLPSVCRQSESAHRESEIFSDVFRILHTHFVFRDTRQSVENFTVCPTYTDRKPHHSVIKTNKRHSFTNTETITTEFHTICGSGNILKSIQLIAPKKASETLRSS